MSTAKQSRFISEEDYLAGEQVAGFKSEYIDGQIYAMTGGSINHNRLAVNLLRQIGNHLEGKPCQPYSSDIKVKIDSKYFYPDVMVDCTPLPGDSLFTQTPVIIVEVLSKSTRRMDETTKRLAYLQIPTLQEYVLIEQDFVQIEIIRRRSGWLPEHYFLGDDITFDAIGLTLTVEEIYDRVQNEDVTDWLAKKAREEAEAAQTEVQDQVPSPLVGEG